MGPPISRLTNFALSKKCHVTLGFSPKLLDDDIRKEACSIIKQEKEEKQRVEQERLRREAEELTQTKPQEEEKNVRVLSKNDRDEGPGFQIPEKFDFNFHFIQVFVVCLFLDENRFFFNLQTKGKKTPKTPAKSKASESSSKSRRNSAKFVEKVNDITLTPDMIDEKLRKF